MYSDVMPDSSGVALGCYYPSVFLLWFLLVMLRVSVPSPKLSVLASCLTLVPLLCPCRVPTSVAAPCPLSVPLTCIWCICLKFPLCFWLSKIRPELSEIGLPALDPLWIFRSSFKLDHRTTIFSQRHTKCTWPLLLTRDVYIVHHSPLASCQVSLVGRDRFLKSEIEEDRSEYYINVSVF